MKLPDAFVRNMMNVFEDGRVWLEHLPGLIKQLEAEWHLEVQAPFANLSYSFVAPAKLQNGAEAILKVWPPCAELSSEIAALQRFPEMACVKLLASDAAKGALLLEKLEPGISFWHTQDDALATRTCAELLLKLWQAPHQDYPFRRLKSWSRALDENLQQPEDPRLSHQLIDKAVQLRDELLQGQEEVLLHADLHHDNILSATRQPYLVIDPKGIVGPHGYDIGSFMLNPWGFGQKPEARRILEQRVAIFSEMLALSREEVIAWSFVHAILSASWGCGDPDADITDALTIAGLLTALA